MLTLRSWGKRLGLSPDVQDSSLETAVSQRLMEVYPGADVLRCVKCGFRSPDTVAVPACPKCNALFDDEKDKGKMGKAAKAPGQIAEVLNLKDSVKKKAAAAQAAAAETAPPPEASATPAEGVAAELAAFEKQIEQVQQSKVLADWDIGSHLKAIFDRDLWRAATNSDGDAYKSFVDYASQRFDFKKDTARAYVRIAEVFTREEAEGLQLTQLWLLARVPDDEKRLELVQQVRGGTIETTRELAAAVKVQRAAAGLSTERKGHEGKLHVTFRAAPGEVASGEFKAVRGGKSMVFAFDLGDQRFQVVRDVQGNNVRVLLLEPPKEQ